MTKYKDLVNFIKSGQDPKPWTSMTDGVDGYNTVAPAETRVKKDPPNIEVSTERRVKKDPPNIGNTTSDRVKKAPPNIKSQQPSNTKSVPGSGGADIKSKITQLQQAILEFKTVAQSTDFGAFGKTVQDPFTRDLTPEQTAQDNATLEQIKIYQGVIDNYYKGAIYGESPTEEYRPTEEYIQSLKTSINDMRSKMGSGKSLQGYKPMNDFFLQKYIAPVSDKVKIWKQNPKNVAEQYVQVEMPTDQRGLKGSRCSSSNRL
jgi:hypothetical protein